jgi:CDP-glucose 4,6-dehydratase
LTLSSALARHSLGWHPRLDIEESLSWTADWYSAYSAGEDMLAFTESQIARYRAKMKQTP